jgi:hypothetical protein
MTGFDDMKASKNFDWRGEGKVNKFWDILVFFQKPVRPPKTDGVVNPSERLLKLGFRHLCSVI